MSFFQSDVTTTANAASKSTNYELSPIIFLRRAFNSGIIPEY
jgi:hypothetical protein